MSHEVQSLTVKELITHLQTLDEEAQVYVSRDEEGNGYGTISVNSIEVGELDKAIAIYPVREHIEYDEVFPAAWEAMCEEDERNVD